MMWYYGTGWGGALSMVLGMVLWFAVLWFVISLLMRWVTGRETVSSMSTGLSAEEILRQRFARGEIDADTFHDVQRHLETSPVHSHS